MRAQAHWAALVIVLLNVCPACRREQATESVTIDVLLAASLMDAVQVVQGEHFDESEPRIRLNAGGSTTLRRQIEHGAPCDVFISADDEQIDRLIEQRLIDSASRTVVARNAMVVVQRKLDDDQSRRDVSGVPSEVPGDVDAKGGAHRLLAGATQNEVAHRLLAGGPKNSEFQRQLDNATQDSSLHRLLAGATQRDNDDRLLADPTQALHRLLAGPTQYVAIANPEYAPAGRYARQALEHFNLWDEVQDKLVLADNVRHAAQYVAAGAVDAAIVYATDAVADRRLAVVFRFPPDAHARIEYVGGACTASDRPEDARSFLAALAQPEAQTTWKRLGFSADAESAITTP